MHAQRARPLGSACAGVRVSGGGHHAAGKARGRCRRSCASRRSFDKKVKSDIAELAAWQGGGRVRGGGTNNRLFRCGLFVGPGSRVQTLPRLRAAVSTRTTHTIRKTMPCRRPQSPETQPGALLALRTGLRKIAPLRAQNASKAAQLTCSNDTPRRNDTTCTARLASLGPSTGQPAIRECTLRPELATRAVLRPGRLQAVVAEKAVGLGLPRASCDTACNIQEVCDPERTLEEARA